LKSCRSRRSICCSSDRVAGIREFIATIDNQSHATELSIARFKKKSAKLKQPDEADLARLAPTPKAVQEQSSLTANCRKEHAALIQGEILAIERAFLE
jgi:hypothetical protein